MSFRRYVAAPFFLAAGVMGAIHTYEAYFNSKYEFKPIVNNRSKKDQLPKDPLLEALITGILLERGISSLVEKEDKKS